MCRMFVSQLARHKLASVCFVPVYGGDGITVCVEAPASQYLLDETASDRPRQSSGSGPHVLSALMLYNYECVHLCICV